MTPSSSYNADRDKDTPSLLVQALELNQSQSSQVINNTYSIIRLILVGIFTDFCVYLNLRTKIQ